MKHVVAWMLLTIATAAAAFDAVTPGVVLRFPADTGAHPGHRIEWWYVTGWLDSPRGPLGFQVTFFRARNPDAEGRASRFAPAQLVFAHAALSDPRVGRLLHADRTARAYPPLVEAKGGTTDVRLDDWRLVREPDAYRTHVEGEDFALELAFEPTQPALLQGDRGFSRKGPSLAQASYYYSEPHLQVRGEVTSRGERLAVTGTAWLDHEWSSEVLAPGATGWDWLGANLDHGGALMAFRIRGKDGATLFATGTYRANGAAAPRTLDDVAFAPTRTWRSPRTGIAYPVAMTVTAAGRCWRARRVPGRP